MNFIYKFEFTMLGCNLDMFLNNEQLIELSEGDNNITSLYFKSSGSTKTIICGTLESKDRTGYEFIDFNLTDKIYKILSLIDSVQNLTISEAEIVLTNKSALLKKGFKEYQLEKGYMGGMLCKKIGKINETKFSDFIRLYNEIRIVQKSTKVIDQSMFWLKIAYTVARDLPDLNGFEVISRFRLLWTSFDLLFNALVQEGKMERLKLETFSQREFVKNYFNNVNIKFYLPQLASANLEVGRGRNPLSVSDDLGRALSSSDEVAISKNSILCLYAIRNANIHGSGGLCKEGDLCNLGFALLNPLVKLSIIELAASVDRE